MKKTLLIFVGLLLSAISFALGKDSADAVIMLDYEQAWNDDTGRLSLKNNTNEPIEDLSFQITYIDMQGRTIGTENFNKDIYIFRRERQRRSISQPSMLTNTIPIISL